MLASTLSYLSWGYLGPSKCDRVLEPISTLCMVALRTLSCYDKAKPAVRGNWFELDEKGSITAAKRSLTQVSNDDLFYLDASIKLLVRGWSANSNPDLVAIATVARDGFKLIADDYLEDCKNAVPTCKYLRKKLKKWIESENKPAVVLPIANPDEKVTQIRAATEFLKKIPKKDAKDPGIEVLEMLVEKWKITPEKPAKQLILSLEDQAFIAKVNELWGTDLKIFADKLKEKEANGPTLIGLLNTRKIAYLEHINKKITK